MFRSKNLIPFLVSFPGWLYIHLVGHTNRFRYEGLDFYTLLKEKKRPYIFALWHSRVMLPMYHFRHCGLAVIVSQSRDGEFITQTMQRVGFYATRGSATRHGAEGLLGLVHWLHQGGSVVITPDGPKGPRETVQPGIIQLAKLTGIPIIPVCFSCSRNYRFASWDRFMLPLPFGTISMVSGDPIEISHGASPDEYQMKRDRLEMEMRRITQIADQLAGTPSLILDSDRTSR